MGEDSRTGQSLWALIVLVAIGVAIVGFLHTQASTGDASAGEQTMTFWVADSEQGSQSETLARQLASVWSASSQAGTVGLLSQGASAAVATFLDRSRHDSDDLLVVTSTTLADLAHDRGEPSQTATELRATRDEQLLPQAPVIAVIASDPLALAVPRESAIESTAALLGMLRHDTSQKILATSASSWLEANLAGLIHRAGIPGPVPYTVFGSSDEALAGMRAGLADVVLAPASAIRSALAAGRLRELAWPTRSRPRAWVALVAPLGTPPATVKALRRETAALTHERAWLALLHGDGLDPVALSRATLQSFVRRNARHALTLQALARSIIRH